MLWLISVAVFVLFFVAPHDPARTDRRPPRHRPTRSRWSGTGSAWTSRCLTQYGHFLARLAHGDLGYSYYNSEPVDSLILSAAAGHRSR